MPILNRYATRNATWIKKTSISAGFFMPATGIEPVIAPYRKTQQSRENGYFTGFYNDFIFIYPCIISAKTPYFQCYATRNAT